ncbi:MULTISPECIES: sarcosine oxidase subunit alpha family protein [unclassified Ruegeria]|uniref:sarcosine oxidase subunit alpha family protein n=1 Tax=unclassified Ruegeria TaxID=2625375 RepID=UPI001491C072|nr:MULTISPECIES: sarcosine oxidase subunit alpha family protein [unclassified Ruegeria]NOD88409.1 sarcosine oxidase subunit alpha family protein [Ruegeria sp. HKCCD4318]NOE13318.1 sarcosine oxidase subunit alpha family protein [Ruegeria sp. HKCCD4318-2]NOG11140.1 sarcosine oxidase subunit alpha family protein [Ruegeria sp. HKCCD4315]
MTQKNRLQGGLVDRSKKLRFTFDGKSYEGYQGDTLASALLANDVRLVGRSFKYHRPRGVLAAGSEEPNALVELRTGNRQEPNTRATTIELFDGLEAKSQNRWPSLAFDAMSINDRLSPFLTAGFYYKTFMWPKAFWEKLYEPMIRKAAGLGSLSQEDDPDIYDKGYLHCDVLVIGAGPSGLIAALTAARSGARVILADEDSQMGGRLLADSDRFEGVSNADWVAQTLGELASMDNVRLLTRTTVFGVYDHGIFGALERVSDHLAVPEAGKPRQILWRVYAKRSVLCAGATERPIAFANNDRPGIMLAGAMREYANRWAVTPGQRVAIFTNNDEGHFAAQDLIRAGVKVVAVIDPRHDVQRIAECELLAGAQVTDAQGRLGLKMITVKLSDGQTRPIEVSGLGVSGGWNPNVQLTCHQRGRPQWSDTLAAFVPSADLPTGMCVAGAAAGELTNSGALASGKDAALAALKDLGIKAKRIDLPESKDEEYQISPLWHVPGKGRAWLDFQNDVTVKDVKLAEQEGFRSVEHLKRYTTLGMATDQGKTANVGALAVMAEITGKSIPETGTTIFRPPYSPVSMGAWAGRSVGKDFKPTRLTPSHQWAEEQGAVFVEVGPWLRAQWFPQPGETHWRQSVDREVLAVRSSVGVCDVTTLGKIDVQGADAAAFLNKVYCNGFAKLPVGKTRYGLMLREDGLVMDDGTAARLAEDHFVVTTTTANAVGVYRHMEFVHQCLFPDMDVQLISATDAWAQFAVAGPKSRELLQQVVDRDFDISNDAFPFMGCAEITIAGGIPARLFRISFSGELAFELAVPTRYGDALIRHLMELGQPLGVTPYGMEALGVLRIEKGHVTGNELNGTVSAHNLGMGRMVSTKKDSIGAPLSAREALVDPDGLALVGIQPVDTSDTVLAGSHVFAEGASHLPQNDQGYVTSAGYSPHLSSSIGLAFVQRGAERLGETVQIVSPVDNVNIQATLVSAHFVDPEGDRLRA